jgi:hypothetical protein
MRLGRGAEVRRCTYTNYCEGLDQMHKQVTCKLWDRLDLDEPGAAMARGERRRLLPPAWEPGGGREGVAGSPRERERDKSRGEPANEAALAGEGRRAAERPR